jgi:lipopolysaccharide/colanic/teichoic acid biosynthesis glycosyltransferase
MPAIPEAPPYYLAAKRAVDVIGSTLGLLLLSPVLLLLMLIVRATSRGPIFHRRRVLAKQNYTGGSLATFDAFKFRTMVANADAVLHSDPELFQEYRKEFKLQNDPRVTRLGHHLRRLSLDELPQLLNVLRGQMTLVGPRMIIPAELENYGPNAAKLLSVKPGITGLWQVSGRTNVSYRERVRLDMWYIENRSLLLDMEILLRTVFIVANRRGAV